MAEHARSVLQLDQPSTDIPMPATWPPVVLSRGTSRHLPALVDRQNFGVRIILLILVALLLLATHPASAARLDGCPDRVAQSICDGCQGMGLTNHGSCHPAWSPDTGPNDADCCQSTCFGLPPGAVPNLPGNESTAGSATASAPLRSIIASRPERPRW